MITPKQEKYLISLLITHGKAAYRAAKEAVGIEADISIPQLSKHEASRLIDQLRGVNR